jgi:hypothetical protein
VSLNIDEALERAEDFRNHLLRRANASPADKRNCHELAAAGFHLDTRSRHDAQFKMACEVIDDLVRAIQDDPPEPA